MDITINIKFSAVVLLLTIFALLFDSCTNENEPAGARIYKGEKIPLSINLGIRNITADNDKAISSVRAIVFNDKDELVYNGVSKASGTDNDATYTTTIRAARGYNNIYIICNETTELTEKLDGITQESQIEEVTFSAIGIVAPPPMYGKVENAFVESRSDGKNATVTIGDNKMTELPVKVTRMVSRLSFTVIKNITEGEDFKVTKLTIKVCHMPAVTPIGEGQVYTKNVWSDDLTVSGTNELKNNGAYTINESNYTVPENVDFISIPNIYIPEHLLSEPKNASQATYLKIDAQCILENGSTQVLNCVYLLDIGQNPPENHNLTRNNHYQIYATITGMGAMGLYAEIVAMEEHDITINWKPIDGLVIVSDKAADYDATADTSKNVNIWNDFTVYSGILKAYHSETGYKDVLFKYGSLIAIHSASEEETEFIAPVANANELNDVLWYPGSYNPLTIKGWSDIPYQDTGEIPENNTVDRVTSGLGDPCKLAGLSESQIKTFGIVDNGQWHMATSDENHILIMAADKENNLYGFPSFHWLLSPHNRYRDTKGISKGDRSNGWYWAKDTPVFSFSGQSQNAELINDINRQNAYMIRCVRNEIPESRMKVGNIVSPTYQGTENSKSSYFGIISNIPYWTATLVTSGSEMGTASPSDFSFEPGGGSIHTTHGSNTQNISVYVKRKESASPRSFRVRVEGIGLDGKTESLLLTVSQSGYDLRAKTGLSNSGNIPQKGGAYETTIQLTPTDVAVPAGKLYLRISYAGTTKCISTEVNTESYKYEYPVSIEIPANDSPSAINLTCEILLARESSSIVSLGSPIISQDGYQ